MPNTYLGFQVEDKLIISKIIMLFCRIKRLFVHFFFDASLLFYYHNNGTIVMTTSTSKF